MKSLFGNWASTLRKNSLSLVLSVLLPTFGMSDSVMAAERIYAFYSPLEVSIPVSALEIYTKTGVLNKELAVYQHYLPSPQLRELRQILLKPVKISPAVASQFLYTPQGEFLLRRLGEVFTTKSRQPKLGFHALRAALISAAGEPEGLTLLTILRKYPNSSIHIDIAHSLGIVAELEKLISETKQAIATVINKSNLEAAIVGTENLSQLPNLATKGQFKSQKFTRKFFDLTRYRQLLTDIYIPQVRNPAPVIVISHGLGLDSSNFRYLAEHLVTHGFAVIVPNHPGSDAKQLHSLINGSADEVAEPEEFYNRPLDIKYILDELAKDKQFQERLNLQQVGVLGQSLGGYTALALAGAEINFEQLAQDCQPAALKDTWNMSLLLQCRALELNQQRHNLRDERVKAVIAINPITSSIFGKSGLSQVKIPVMLVGCSEDTVAPALYEQILPFSWFTHPQKYLVMLVGGTHFSTIGNSQPGSEQIPLPAEMVGDASQARSYMNTLSLPFFQAYVAAKPQYIPYLNAAYTKTIVNKSLGLHIVQSLSTTELPQTVGNTFATKPVKKQLSNIIVKCGFWMLDVGISLLRVMIYL
jgi:predicted dienelactone hydrolase